MAEQFALDVLLGVILGTMARLAFLKVDYRQYPSVPHGYINHLSLGIVAALIGAVAIPALVAEEYTAVTFLALAASQFREVRDLERRKLRSLDSQILVSRGSAYIEGIARVFESRNYLVIFVSLVTSTLSHFVGTTAAAVGGLLILAIFYYRQRDEVLAEIANFEVVDVRFEGPNLYAGDIYMMNIGLEQTRVRSKDWGMGVLIEPKDESARDTLDDVGQRQAIVHDVSAVLGNHIDIATPEFTPLIRKEQDSGTLGLYITPMTDDEAALLAVLERVPVLESARGSALHTIVGRMVKD